jgi:SAM-dependent methyltransferase
MDLKEEEILGNHVGAHWYYRAKLAALLSHLCSHPPPRRILDVGAGAGFFSKALLELTDATSTCCVDTSYAADRDEFVSGKRIQFRRWIDAIDADLVLLMDVLEHVDNDGALLREYLAKVPRGARFFISVPAFPFLWSQHDVFLEHRRRYHLRQLEAVVRDSGLDLIRGSYYYGLVFPLAAATRLSQRLVGETTDKPRSQLQLHHPLLNELLFQACRTELLFHRWNRLAGLSAICLARKP